MMELIQPLETVIEGKTFILSKVPAIAGREIFTQYATSAIPKVGDYGTNEALMLKLMHFVAIELNGVKVRLDKKELIDNHVSGWEMLMRIEKEMLEYNCSFFQSGRLSNFFEDIAQKVQAWATKTLMASSAQSSPTEKQHSTNSEPSTV